MFVVVNLAVTLATARTPRGTSSDSFVGLNPYAMHAEVMPITARAVYLVSDSAFREVPMPTTRTEINDFLSHRRIALVGVSRNPQDFSRAVFRELATRGYEVVPVNPLGGNNRGPRLLPACAGHQSAGRSCAADNLAGGNRKSGTRLRRSRHS